MAKATKKAAKESTPALDALIDEIYDLRNEIRTVGQTVEKLKEEKEEKEKRLIEMMDAVGTDMSRSEVATATISETVIPQVVDWDAFYKFIKRNNAFYMLERRPASVAYRETLKQRNNKPIPGVSSFTKRAVGIRVRATK